MKTGTYTNMGTISEIAGRKIDFILAKASPVDTSIPFHPIVVCQINKLLDELKELNTKGDVYFFDAFSTPRERKDQDSMFSVFSAIEIKGLCKEKEIELHVVMFGWQHTSDQWIELVTCLGTKFFSLVSSVAAIDGTLAHDIVNSIEHGWALNGDAQLIESLIDNVPDNGDIIFWNGDYYVSEERNKQALTAIAPKKFEKTGRVRILGLLTMRESPSLSASAVRINNETGITGEVEYTDVSSPEEGVLTFIKCNASGKDFWLAAQVAGKMNVEIL